MAAALISLEGDSDGGGLASTSKKLSPIFMQVLL